MNIFADAKTLTVVVVAVILVTIAVYAAHLGYPLNEMDSKFIFPTAISYALNHQLSNEFAQCCDLAQKPIDQNKISEWGHFLDYPPLFPVVTSLFISPRSALSAPEQAMIALGIMNAIELILVCLISYKLATIGGRKLDWAAVLMIGSVLLITLEIAWTFGGKPETLSRLFFALGFLVPFYIKKRWWLISTFSLLLGLIAVTHPVGAIFFVPAVASFFLFSNNKDWLRGVYDTMVVSGIGFIVFLLLLQLSPYSKENISTMFATGKLGVIPSTHLSPGWIVQVIKNSAVAYNRPIYAVYAALFLFALYQLYRSRKAIGLHPLFFVPAAVFAVVMLRFLRYRTYYLSLFTPLIIAASIYYAAVVAKRRVVTYGILFVLLFSALISAKPLTLLPSFIKDGTTIHAGREELKETFLTHPNAYYFISYEIYPLWSRPESYAKVYELQTEADYYGVRVTSANFREDGSGPIIVLAQNDRSYEGEGGVSMAPPESVLGCPLASDHYVKVQPEIFGIRLANVMPGYGFAVYKCT